MSIEIEIQSLELQASLSPLSCLGVRFVQRVHQEPKFNLSLHSSVMDSYSTMLNLRSGRPEFPAAIVLSQRCVASIISGNYIIAHTRLVSVSECDNCIFADRFFTSQGIK